MTPGDVLKTLRKERGMRQEDVAREAGLDRSVVNQIERGKRGVGPKTAAKLGELFKVAPERFLSRQEEGQPSRLQWLEGEVSRLTESQEEAQLAHDLLLARVEELERRVGPERSRARRVELASREGPIRRGRSAS